jgi:hypothetical protein
MRITKAANLMGFERELIPNPNKLFQFKRIT